MSDYCKKQSNMKPQKQSDLKQFEMDQEIDQRREYHQSIYQAKIKFFDHHPTEKKHRTKNHLWI